MKLEIEGTEYELGVLRDAIQDKYHELKRGVSDRAHLNAIICNFVAKRMSERLMVNCNVATVISMTIPDLSPAREANQTHVSSPASPTGKRPQILPDQKQVRRPQQDSTIPHEKAQPKAPLTPPAQDVMKE